MLFRTLLKRIGLHGTKLNWQLIEVPIQTGSRVKMILRFVDDWYLPRAKGKDTKVILFFSPSRDEDVEITACLGNFNLSGASKCVLRIQAFVLDASHIEDVSPFPVRVPLRYVTADADDDSDDEKSRRALAPKSENVQEVCIPPCETERYCCVT